jgi:replicative DNA helicase
MALNVVKLEPAPGRVPPSDLDAEAAVLSAALLDDRALAEVSGIIQPVHFYADANRRIYMSCLELQTSGKPVDAVAVAGHLRDIGRLEQIGGASYLAQLTDMVPYVANVLAHAHRVREKWRLRQLISTCQKVAAEGYGDTGDIDTFVAQANLAIADIAGNSPVRETLALTSAAVLTEWAHSGPLIHEPTGIPVLDELTGGGPVYGTRWFLAGSPDAGKTALLVQLAHVYLLRGVTVGLLAVDEEAGDIVTRLAQRLGYSRSHCEVRDPTVLKAIDCELGALPLRFYDGTWTIEEAATDLARFATQRSEQDPSSHPYGPRAMLGIDSVQTVRCAADALATATGREQSEVTAVTSRVQAIRAVASKHRLIAMATSELGRSAYRSSDPSQQTATLAAGKWSGAIEYSARVLLGIRSVANETDLIELELAKNKHGPRDEKLHLRIDRPSQTLWPVVYQAPPEASAADRDATARDRVTTDAVVVARVLLAKPGASVRGLRSAVRAASGIGSERVDAALEALGAAVVYGRGPRGAKPMSLDLGLLDERVRLVVEGDK